MADSKINPVKPVGHTDYFVPISGSVNPGSESENSLCVTELADGRALCVWHNGSQFRGIVVDHVRELLKDNVTTSSGGTLILSASVADYSSCFMVGSNVFLNLIYYDGSTTINRLFVANDPTNPLAGWSTRYTFGTGAGRLSDMPGAAAGIPMVIGSRWIMPTPVVTPLFGSDSFYRMGVYTSEDNGFSFTKQIDLGFYVVFGSFMHMQGGQVIVMPDGRLMVPGWGTVTGIQRAFSSNDGATWTSDNPASEAGMSPYLMQAISHDGTNTYVALNNGFYTIDNSGLTDTLIGTFPGDASFYNFKAIWCPVASQMIYCHTRTRISASGRNWWVGANGFVGFN